MIRELVKDKITREVCKDWAMRQHLNSVSYETLEVYPDGDLMDFEEPSSNTWHTGTHVLTHTYGVPCNCDCCAEWDSNTDGCQSEFESKSDFIEACLDNTDEVSQLQDSIWAKIDDIPFGFFNDEE
jgi:hypothetical protein